MKDISTIEVFKGKNVEYLTDPLTKVLNKGALYPYVEYLIGTKLAFTFFFIDIDYFKAINDTYGHQKGDEILELVARKLNDVVGDDGLVFRFGGDEFVIVKEDMKSYDETWAFSRRVCLAISNMGVPLDADSKVQTVTITMGSAAFPSNGLNSDDVIDNADKALYRGKQKGRNCFIIFNKSLHENIRNSEDASKLEICKIQEFLFKEFGDTTIDLETKMKSICNFIGINYHLTAIVAKVMNDKIELFKKDKNAEYFLIPEHVYEKLGFRYEPILSINYRLHYENKHQVLVDLLKAQNINSEIVVRIETKNKYYGYLRGDYKHERVWTPDIKIILQTIASLFAMELEREQKNV